MTMKIQITTFLAVSWLLLSSCGLSVDPPNSAAVDSPNITAVAHAGGGVNKKRYTNSMEALDFSANRGFKLIELDFSWTKDGHIVCLHDWDTTPKWMIGYRGGVKLNLAEFNDYVKSKKGLTPCDLFKLNDWLKQHPDVYIITDVKGNNIKALKLMIEIIDNAKRRVIPQFTQPKHYQPIRDLGFDKLIWTLYSYNESNDELIQEASKMTLFAITMPPKRAKTKVAFSLADMAIPTYVHTINDLSVAIDYQETYGLSSVYTDFLPVVF